MQYRNNSLKNPEKHAAALYYYCTLQGVKVKFLNAFTLTYTRIYVAYNTIQQFDTAARLKHIGERKTVYNHEKNIQI